MEPDDTVPHGPIVVLKPVKKEPADVSNTTLKPQQSRQ
jgi:hypothetical protein